MIEKVILNGEEHELSPEYSNIRNKPKINGVELSEGDNSIDIVDVEINSEINIVDDDVSPSVINEGTPTKPKLKFNLNKGPKGEQGEQGDRGEQGEQGTGLTASHNKDGKTTTIVISTNEETPQEIDSFQINDGNNGHNPCVGRFTSYSELSIISGQNGDYAYVDTISGGDVTTKVYHYTTEWEAEADGVEVTGTNTVFNSGQDIADTPIKDQNGDIDQAAQGVLSAESGKMLGDEVYGEYAYNTLDVELSNGYHLYSYSNNNIKEEINSLASTYTVKLPCQEGQKFMVYGAGRTGSDASVGRLWAFTEELSEGYYNAIEVADSEEVDRDNGVVLTAPAGSVFLFINFFTYNALTDFIQKWEKSSLGLVDKTKFKSGEDLSDTSIVDNLATNSVTDVLSAKQGMKLGEEIYGTDEETETDYTDEVTTGAYYATNNTSLLPKNPTSSQSTANYSCIRIHVNEGDRFVLSTKGDKNYVRGWVFTNESRVGVSWDENATTNTIYNNVPLTAPQDGYLYVNTLDNTNYLIHLTKIETKHIKGIKEKVEQSPWKDKTIVLFGDSISELAGTNNDKRWSDYAKEILGATIINCAIAGSRISRRRDIITSFDQTEDYAVNDLIFYNPNGVMCFYQCIETHSAGAWDASHFASLFDIYTPLTVDDMVMYQPINGQMGLYKCTSAHAAGDWDATHFVFQEYITLKAAPSNAYANLDIVSMIEAACSDDENKYDIISSANSYLTAHHRDENDSIIEGYTNIDWTDVDAVIIMGGANDYEGGLNYNRLFDASNKYNTKKVLGAVNSIVKTFCTKYKSIPLYFASDPIRWFNYGANAEEINWCDTWYGFERFDPEKNVGYNDYIVYNPNGGDVFNSYRCTNQNGHSGEWVDVDFTEFVSNVITYTEFTETVMLEWKKLHMPVIDLYNMLGWNQWNFSQYFPQDGTHPRLGFKNIGEYISRWLIAHKNA